MDHPANLKQRAALRETWLGSLIKGKGEVVEYAFFVERMNSDRLMQELKEEQERFHDIFFVETKGSHIPQVKTLALLEQGVARKATCIMKAEDDIFFDNKVLDRYLTFCEDRLVGNIYSDSTPHRGSSSRYYISQQEYPQSYYPDYPQRGLFFIGARLAEEILRHKGRLIMLRLEDVTVGLWVQEVLQRDPTRRFSFFNLGSYYSAPEEGPCWRRDAWVVQGLSPLVIQCLFSALDSQHKLGCCASKSEF